MSSQRPLTSKAAIGVLGFVGATAVAGGFEMLAFPDGNVFVKHEWLDDLPVADYPPPRPHPRRRSRRRLPGHRVRADAPTTLELAPRRGTHHRTALVVGCNRHDGYRPGGLDPARDRTDSRAVRDRGALRPSRRRAARRVRNEVVPHLARHRTGAVRAALTWWSASTFVVLWVGFVVLLVVDRDSIESLDEWLDDRPLPIRVALWVLLLPIAVGLKAWTSSSTALRVGALVGLLLWTWAAATSVVRLVSE